MYQIKRCRQCKRELHLHYKSKQRVKTIRNGCEHVPNGPITNSDIEKKIR